MYQIQKITGAKSEADPFGVLPNELLCIEPNHFPSTIQQWATGTSWINGRVGLDAGARTCIWKFTNGTHNAFGETEQHGVTGIADRQHRFALVNKSGVRKRQMGEGEVRRRRCSF